MSITGARHQLVAQNVPSPPVGGRGNFSFVLNRRAGCTRFGNSAQHVGGRFGCRDVRTQRDAIYTGFGIGLRPAGEVRRAQASGELERVLPRRALEAIPVYASQPPRARLGVADLLERGPLSAIEIAERTGTNADAMARTLRALVFKGIFSRRGDGKFENNRVSPCAAAVYAPRLLAAFGEDRERFANA